MFLTKKWKKLIFKTKNLVFGLIDHQIIVANGISTLEKRIEFLEKRNQENESIIEHLIIITKPLDKREYIDENQHSFL